MRSLYADKFNHDADAPGYDRDVRNEADPIRAGYATLLDWVAGQAAGARSVLELGTGTGNLTARLSGCRRVVCVDVSREMLRIARGKLAGTISASFIESDILEYFDQPGERFDAVVSTYAVHHLTENEKSMLFHAVRSRLAEQGIVVFGDLMFRDDGHRARYLEALRDAGRDDFAEDIEDEFFWDVGAAVRELEGLGFEVAVRRFSELSCGIAARGTERTRP